MCLQNFFKQVDGNGNLCHGHRGGREKSDKAVLLRNASVSVKEVPMDNHMMLSFEISLNETCCC